MYLAFTACLQANITAYQQATSAMPTDRKTDNSERKSWHQVGYRLPFRLAIQDKPFAAPLRLIAAGLELHSAPLAPPPYKHQGGACIPLTPATDVHSTAAAQGAHSCILSPMVRGSVMTI